MDAWTQLAVLGMSAIALASGCRDATRPQPLAPAEQTANRDSSSALPWEPAAESPSTIERRRALVARVEEGVPLTIRVKEALLTVPRHLFVPDSQQGSAYDDGPLAIGQGQTVSQPTVVAMMTEALELQGSEVVLEIGSGSGYQAAVLSRLCRRVESIEIIPTLATRAQAVLAALNYNNVRVHVGDGYLGLPQLAPFDAIILTAAPPEIPTKLLDQLREGGRLVLPVGPELGDQELLVLRKQGGQVHRKNLGGVRFVPLVPGKRQ